MAALLSLPVLAFSPPLELPCLEKHASSGDHCPCHARSAFSLAREFAPHEPLLAERMPLVRRAFDAFGPDRMIWGGLGQSMEEFSQQIEMFEFMFDFAPEADRARIRGLNAMKLFGFKA